MRIKPLLAALILAPLWAFPTLAADSTVTAMPAAGALTGPELFYCIQGGVDSKCTAAQMQTFGGGPPGGASLTLQYNNAGAFGGMSGTSWNDTNRSLTITGVTLAGGSFPVLALTQTWNNAATAFEGFTIDITTTAQSALSTLFSVKRNGTPKLWLNPADQVAVAGDLVLTSTTGRIYLRNGGTFLSSPANASLQIGNVDAAAPVAQTLSVQSVVAGTANTAGANWTFDGSHGTGTGAGGSIIFRTAPAGGAGSAQNAYATAVTIDSPGTLRVKGFTVATLPAAGTAGRIAYVSDQLTACPALGGTFTGGGAVVCKAFDDGTNWTHQ